MILYWFENFRVFMYTSNGGYWTTVFCDQDRMMMIN